MTKKQVLLAAAASLGACAVLIFGYLSFFSHDEAVVATPVPEHWGQKIKLTNHPNWGDEIYLEFDFHSQPLTRLDLEKAGSSEAWIAAYLSNRDFRTIGYDELASLSTHSALVGKGVETREKFDARVKLIVDYYKTHPDRLAPNKAVLWRTTIEIKGQRYMLICAVDEVSLSDVPANNGFKKLTLLKMEERWKFEGPLELERLGLSAFPWDDKNQIELILANHCAKYEDQRISPCARGNE